MLHVDFARVSLTEKTHADVPLHFVNESPAVRTLGAVLLHARSEVSVEAFPQDIPHSIEVDLSGLLEIDDAIFVRDLKVDATLIQIENDPDELVVKAVPVKVEEEKPAEAAVPAEGEVAAEGEEGEAAAPAAGAEGAKPAAAGAKPAAAGAKPPHPQGAAAGARRRRTSRSPRRRVTGGSRVPTTTWVAGPTRDRRPPGVARDASSRSPSARHPGTDCPRAPGFAAPSRLPSHRRRAPAPSRGGSDATWERNRSTA